MEESCCVVSGAGIVEDPDKIKKYLASIEEVAEEILADKEQLIVLDSKRQKNREALRLLGKDSETKKPWICIGNMFVKLPKEKTSTILENDQAKLEEEIQNLRKKLKENVKVLREMEGQSELHGFELQALSKDEMRALDKVLQGKT